MNRSIAIALLAVIAMACASCQTGRAVSDKPISHPFLCSDYGGNMIHIVSAEGEIVWQYPANRPQDVWQMPNGNILFTHLRGVKEVTRDKEVVWEYSTNAPNEIQSCQPLAGGNYLVAVSGPCELLEIDRNGKMIKTVKLIKGQTNVHAQMRQVRKLRNGNYIVAHNMDNVVKEYDGSGRVIREIALGGNSYAGLRLPNGNTIIAGGDGHYLAEVDADDNVVWRIDENELEGNPLRFVAGIQRLRNGNTVVCNWGGHGHVGGQPQIFEVTPDKKVVWQIFDYEKFNTISNIQLLDVKGDVTKGKIIK